MKSVLYAFAAMCFVQNVNILFMSNKTAIIELNVISIDTLVEDLVSNKFKIVNKENKLFISKDESLL